MKLRWIVVLVSLGTAGCPAEDPEDAGTSGNETSSSGGSSSGGETTSNDDSSSGSEGSTGNVTTSNDTTSTGTTSNGTSSTGDGLVTHACGTYDPAEGPYPQDPDDPEILAACEAECDAFAELGCAVGADTCVETCKLRSCIVCPDTLADLVQCEADNAETLACVCDGDDIQCEYADSPCEELALATSACGG